jgi:hypothetical protein
MGKPCAKKRAFRDELGAKIALASAKRRDKGERRYYPCNICHKWHLTSQELRTPLLTR